MTYQTPPGVVFEWAHWEEESVVFDPRSGLTHLLDPVATECLLVLSQGPRDLETVLSELREAAGGALTEDVRAGLHWGLRQMEAIGLLEAVAV